MNTHQKVFFSGAVALGFVAAAFASSPVPSKAEPVAVQFEQATVIGHRSAMIEQVTFEQSTVVGHRSELIAASRKVAASKDVG